MPMMNDDTLDVSLQGQAPTITIALRGDLTFACGEAVERGYQEATAQGARNIVVDFAKVDYMHTLGIQHLIKVLIAARAANQRVVFASLIPHNQKILTMMGLKSHVGFYDTVADAYRSLEADA